ncbi:MAG: DUF4238 domain-containing protein [Chloroherpetonaceae bacterium]
MKNLINNLFSNIGRKIRNFVFRHRLGKKVWSAKLIIFIMDIFDRFEIYTNTGNVGRFDHYVPKLLLSKWRIAESGTDKGLIFGWSKIDNKIKKVPLSGEAGAIDWDVSNSQGIASDFLSKKLFAELLEEKAAKVIKLINNDSSIKLTFLEESTLAVFIAHQITRVPAFHASLTRFFSIGYSNNLIDYEDFGNKDVLTQKVAFNGIGITYDQFLKEKPHALIEDGKPQKILISLIIASDIAEKIHQGNLHILEIPSGSSDEFVISDNPVIFFDTDRKEMLTLVPWWEIGKNDFLIFMPISRNKAIFYSKSKKKDGPIENQNESFVQLFNYGQYLLCTNKVFSQSQLILTNQLKMYDSELRSKGIIK